MSGLVYILCAHSTEKARRLNRLGHEHANLVVAAVPPDHQVRLGDLARAVLLELGKRFDVVGESGPFTSREISARAWMAAHGVTDLVITGAERISVELAHQLHKFASSVGVRVTLVEYAEASTNLGRWLELVPHERSTIDELIGLWDDREAASESTGGWADWPQRSSFPCVPTAHGGLFRPDCRRFLRPVDFRIVDSLYTRTFASALAVFETPMRKRHPQQVSRLFLGVIDDYPDPDALVTAARAIQAAGLRTKWAVDVDELAVRYAGQRAGLSAYSPTDWEALHVFVRTDAPAVLALISSGLSIAEVLKARIGDVSPGSTAVMLHDPESTGRPVVARAQVFLEAHRMKRTLSGASPSDPLFAYRGRTSKSNLQRCKDVALMAASTAGVPSTLRSSAHHDSADPVARARACGVTFRVTDRVRSKTC
ncbi:MAG TPA: hypothetical protein VM143_16480 [Acidimicrobiales bacterium]|nr:hypothetical protein [Acidimicrobiales bacterium]